MATRVVLHKVFTPTTPAVLTFVERESINDLIVNALRTPGKQLVVYGHTGSGKTTLLVNKLEQIYERHITTRCMAGVTFDQLLLDAFDQLEPYYTREISQETYDAVESGLRAQYLGIKAGISSMQREGRTTTSVRVLPPQLTPQTLARLLGKARSCWVLDDFHKIAGIHKRRVAQMMKLVMDTAQEFQDVRVVALGAVDTAREVVEYDPEMRNRVAEIHVPLMDDKELTAIVEKGAALLNVEFAPDVMSATVRHSSGMAAICHHLCLNACMAANVVETVDATVRIDSKEFATAIQQYLDEASDTLRSAFTAALRRERVRRYDNGRLILEALADCDMDGGSHAELLGRIHKREPQYPAANLTQYLEVLQTTARGGLVRKDSAANKYAFADPLSRAFAVAYFAGERKKGGAVKQARQVAALDLSEALEILRKTLLAKSVK